MGPAHWVTERGVDGGELSVPLAELSSLGGEDLEDGSWNGSSGDGRSRGTGPFVASKIKLAMSDPSSGNILGEILMIPNDVLAVAVFIARTSLQAMLDIAKLPLPKLSLDTNLIPSVSELPKFPSAGPIIDGVIKGIGVVVTDAATDVLKGAHEIVHEYRRLLNAGFTEEVVIELASVVQAGLEIYFDIMNKALVEWRATVEKMLKKLVLSILPSIKAPTHLPQIHMARALPVADIKNYSKSVDRDGTIAINTVGAAASDFGGMMVAAVFFAVFALFLAGANRIVSLSRK